MITYIAHYASEYYDPVKAHEYYEEHKKLKGNNRTRTLNDKGNEAKLYVKKSIDEKQESSISEVKSDMDKQISENASTLTNEVTDVYAELLALNSEDKKGAAGKKLKKKIKYLRQKNNEEKSKLKKACSEAIANLKSYYSDVYNEELDKIYEDSETSVGKNTSTSSTSSFNYGVKEQSAARKVMNKNRNT